VGSLPADSAELINVQSLYRDCQAPESSALWGLCMGYVSGVGSALLIVGFAERQHPDQNYSPLAICGEMSNGAMVQAFINWAKKNPREWTKSQFSGVATALTETWPCPN
jgi:hypothetical protein